MNVDEAYQWIQKQYERCINGEITEEQYNEDLEEYKKILGSVSSTSNQVSGSTGGKKKVLSTSIAGLRSKLLDELRKEK